METIGAYEAKTNLGKLLERVRKGERITITKHGVPVAVLQPPDPQNNVDTQAVIAAIKQFRTQNQLNGLSIQEMISEGRR